MKNNTVVLLCVLCCTICAKEYPKGEIIAGSLNIREKATVESSVLAAVKKGMIVEIGGETEAWFRVRTTNGIIGYASKKYVRLLGPAQEPKRVDEFAKQPRSAPQRFDDKPGTPVSRDPPYRPLQQAYQAPIKTGFFWGLGLGSGKQFFSYEIEQYGTGIRNSVLITLEAGYGVNRFLSFGIIYHHLEHFLEEQYYDYGDHWSYRNFGGMLELRIPVASAPFFVPGISVAVLRTKAKMSSFSQGMKSENINDALTLEIGGSLGFYLGSRWCLTLGLAGHANLWTDDYIKRNYKEALLGELKLRHYFGRTIVMQDAGQ